MRPNLAVSAAFDLTRERRVAAEAEASDLRLRLSYLARELRALRGIETELHSYIKRELSND